jgi:hypothetical protein
MIARPLVAFAVPLLLSTAVPAVAQLDPTRAHIGILEDAVVLHFYPIPEASGEPVIVLDARGLWISQELVCRWPNGAKPGDSLLQCPDDVCSGAASCARHLPIVSALGDNGLGGPVLRIEVRRKLGRWIEVEYRGMSYFVDLQSLPGRPREDVEDVEPRGTETGWAWEPSEEEEREQRQRRVKETTSDVAYQTFITSARACWTSGDPHGCFSHFVASEIPYPSGLTDASGPQFSERPMSADEFTDLLWRADHAGRPFWQSIEDCLTAAPYDAGDDDVLFLGPDGWHCEVSRTELGWRLTDVYLGC